MGNLSPYIMQSNSIKYIFNCVFPGHTKLHLSYFKIYAPFPRKFTWFKSTTNDNNDGFNIFSLNQTFIYLPTYLGLQSYTIYSISSRSSLALEALIYDIDFDTVTDTPRRFNIELKLRRLAACTPWHFDMNLSHSDNLFRVSTQPSQLHFYRHVRVEMTICMLDWSS